MIRYCGSPRTGIDAQQRPSSSPSRTTSPTSRRTATSASARCSRICCTDDRQPARRTRSRTRSHRPAAQHGACAWSNERIQHAGQPAADGTRSTWGAGEGLFQVAMPTARRPTRATAAFQLDSQGRWSLEGYPLEPRSSSDVAQDRDYRPRTARSACCRPARRADVVGQHPLATFVIRADCSASAKTGRETRRPVCATPPARHERRRRDSTSSTSRLERQRRRGARQHDRDAARVRDNSRAIQTSDRCSGPDAL